jgi:hypothetical protein
LFIKKYFLLFSYVSNQELQKLQYTKIPGLNVYTKFKLYQLNIFASNWVLSLRYSHYWTKSDVAFFLELFKTSPIIWYPYRKSALKIPPSWMCPHVGFRMTSHSKPCIVIQSFRFWVIHNKPFELILILKECIKNI